MFFRRKPKQQSLYYLLPGMSRANREKRRKIFWVSIIAGLLAGIVVGAVIWLANSGPRL